MSSKASKMIAIFSTVSVFSACMFAWINSESAFEDEYDNSYLDDEGLLAPQEEQRLLDDNGNEYTLFSNPYGSETASFDNGEQVTFSRDDDGSLNFISGSAGLLAGMLASYYLFHGYNPPAGRWNPNTNRYTVTDKLNRLPDADRTSAIRRYLPENTKLNSPDVALKRQQEEQKMSASGGSSARSGSSTNNGKTGSSSVGSTKKGFGGVGARSAAS